MQPTTVNLPLYDDIKKILTDARHSAYRVVNFTMVVAYWKIGKRIVEHEQGGNVKAEYGNALMKDLASRLTAAFGKGFTETNLKYFRQFYIAFPPVEKSHAVRDESSTLTRNKLRPELGWMHYRLLLKVEMKRLKPGIWSRRLASTGIPLL